MSRITADGEIMQTMSARWFGAGHSTATDSAKAGAEAAAAALDGRTPAAVVVFASSRHDLPALLAAVRAEAGPEPVLVGGTSIAEMSGSGLSERGVAMAAFGGDSFQAQARVARIGKDGHRPAGAEVAGALAEVDAEHRAMVLIFDGFSGNPHEVVRGAYSVVGAGVPLVGGLTGDTLTTKAPRTHQFFSPPGSTEVQSLTNSVVGLAIGSDRPIGVGIAHGWQRTEPAMIVTQSMDGTIAQIDGRPALDVLAERLGTEATAEALFRNGIFSIGLSRRSGEDVRVIHGGNDADRTVDSAAVVPQGALFWVMEADHNALVAGAKQSVAEALDGLGGEPALGLLAFDCGGRLAQLGEAGARDEIAAVREMLSDTPFAGLYTMGEVARFRGALGMHHLTLVTLALA